MELASIKEALSGVFYIATSESDQPHVRPFDGAYEDGYLYIKGRSKNMLLGANGQNIYPEEIEDKLSAMPYVGECIVIQKGEHLYALIHPNYEEAERDNVDGEALLRQLEQNRKDLNEQIPAYERIQGIKIFEEEFEKTAKRTIKRYLYVNEEV